MDDELPPGVANYDEVAVPEDVDPEDLTHHPRRAEIWAVIKRAGSPSAVSQRQLANRYDVSPSTISRDFDRIAQFVETTMGDQVRLRGRAAMERAVDAALERGEESEAWKITREWLEFCQRVGDVPKAPDRHEVLHGEVDPTETASYQIVTGDDEPVGGEAPGILTADDIAPALPDRDGEGSPHRVDRPLE